MCQIQVVFFGFLIGNPVWGTLADKFGRKKVNGNSICMMYILVMH